MEEAWDSYLEDENPASYAFQQLRDVIESQEQVIHGLKSTMAIQEEKFVSKEEYEAVVKKLEEEKAAHAQTKGLLAKETEKLQFALGEVEVLSKQLEREKQAFEKALSSVKNKVLTESTKKDKLITKCNGGPSFCSRVTSRKAHSQGDRSDCILKEEPGEEIESHIIKQEDILNGKENEIKELQNVISHQKQIFRHQISDFRIQKQQENYVAQVLDRKQKKASGLLSTRGFKGLGDK
ncbi:spermatogenesis-associated protein 24 isoform X1 [Monodelphis domestica]|uniref:spermatogenesis-associated protein 24 isoform X1 n=2 Tax=Monodelphis domestica TaxID=13616 RepID=UPI000443346A|nr:spermatogenesis-associated protein 24 isoform X1 [Monodelphis domestica]